MDIQKIDDAVQGETRMGRRRVNRFTSCRAAKEPRQTFSRVVLRLLRRG